jgi:DNA polymerase-1
MNVLIDGDYLAYRSVFLTDGAAGSTQDLADMLIGMCNEWVVDACAAYDTEATKVVLCMSKFRKKNFRHDLYAGYKASRKDRETPEYLPKAYEMIDEGVIEGTTVCSQEGLEADDLLGIYQTTFDNTCIVTVDKDLLTIPGRHWNPIKKIKDDVTEEWADYRFHLQWLTGDSTDCIPGLPGIGPKKAAKILDASEESYEQVVMNAYKEHGMDYDYCVLMGRLVKILTNAEAHTVTKKGIKFNLWTPSGKKWKRAKKK